MKKQVQGKSDHSYNSDEVRKSDVARRHVFTIFKRDKARVLRATRRVIES